MKRLESFFQLSKHKTDVKTEIIAGITTFVTMAYALLVIPNILKFSGMNALGIQGDGATELTILGDPVIASVFTGTCIVAALATLIMGIYANLPFAVAPGIGLTAFFSYSVCIGMGYTWQQGLAAVAISGIVFIGISITSIREKIIESLPENMKLAITSGIGLYIALIGFKSGGIVVSDPGTLVAFGNFRDPNVILTVIGITVMGIFMARRVKGAILFAILLTTIIGIPMGVTETEGIKIFSMPFSLKPTFMQLDFQGLLIREGAGIWGAISSIVMVILTFSIVGLFDTIGTLVGTAQKANMIQPDGKIRNMKKALLVDSIATIFSAIFGVTTAAIYVESAAGIAEGGRTGLSTVVVSGLFTASLFLGGVVGIVPAEATAPALIMVGVLMMESVKGIDFGDFTEGLPAFFTIAMMPFSYSIANGIATGIIFYPIMKGVTGRYKEVHPIMYILAVLFIFRFIILP